jgi:hypothetical protein
MRSRYRSGCLLALCVAAGPAFAQGTAAQRAACTPDVFRLCSGDIPNVSRIVACLKREKPKLSAGCGQVISSLDTTQTATRSTRDVGAWCDFGAQPAPGQDVWVAWCEEARPTR